MNDFYKTDLLMALIEILISKNIFNKEELEEFTIKIKNNIKNVDHIITNEDNESIVLHASPDLSPLEKAEKDILIKAFNELDGNKSEMSRYLQITRKTLINKLRKYELYDT